MLTLELLRVVIAVLVISICTIWYARRLRKPVVNLRVCDRETGELVPENVSNLPIINLPDATASTALHWACRGRHPEVVEMLLKHGAAIDQTDGWGKTPLMVAAEAHSESCVQQLL